MINTTPFTLAFHFSFPHLLLETLLGIFVYPTSGATSSRKLSLPNSSTAGSHIDGKGRQIEKSHAKQIEMHVSREIKCPVSMTQSMTGLVFNNPATPPTPATKQIMPALHFVCTLYFCLYQNRRQGICSSGSNASL